MDIPGILVLLIFAVAFIYSIVVEDRDDDDSD